MKHLFLLSAFVLALSFSAAAQVENIPRPQTSAPVASDALQQGNWLFGSQVGNIGMNFRTNTFSFNINPRVGYFISDNAVIGTQAILGANLYDGDADFSYGLTPFLRYYFPEGGRASGRFFGEAILGFAGSGSRAGEGDRPISGLIGLSAGYAHFVARNVALEGLLSYTSTKADVPVGQGNSGLSIGFGFQIYLPGARNR